MKLFGPATGQVMPVTGTESGELWRRRCRLSDTWPWRLLRWLLSAPPRSSCDGSLTRRCSGNLLFEVVVLVRDLLNWLEELRTFRRLRFSSGRACSLFAMSFGAQALELFVAPLVPHKAAAARSETRSSSVFEEPFMPSAPTISSHLGTACYEL
jgi:hypothetical protein